MSELIPLTLIDPNPYQTRAADDPDHVAGLAESIRVDSLLQIPTGRRAGARVQLAFGHSRLAAYRLLAERWPQEPQWQTFPVEIRALTDRQMSDQAAAENARRKNLSAIETARALQRRIDDFKLTQATAGEPFGLTQSAVANLVRLLKLPEAVQADVHAGVLPERLARQLVTVSAIDAKAAAQLGKEIAKAPADDREEKLEVGLAEILERRALDLHEAPWPDEWPAVAISLNGQSQDELTELRPCQGCPHKYHSRSGWSDEDYCLLPACFEIKKQRYPEHALAEAAKKHGVPAVGPGEDVDEIFGTGNYRDTDDAKRVLKAARKQPALGLRLRWLDRDSYGMRNVTGDGRIGLATTDVEAVKNFLKAGAAVSAKSAQADATPQSQAALAKAREHEEEARAERREESAARLRVEADVVWLVKSYCETVAAQLTISGAVLAYVVGRLIHSNRSQASQFYGLMDWYDDLEERADEAKGKPADELRRRMLVAAEVFEHALPYGGPSRNDCWEDVIGKLEDLASTDLGEQGLGARLPAGWNKPPVHHTDYNCWHCGTFAPQRTVPKYLLEQGWVVTMKGDEIADVICDDCASKPAAKAPAKKGKKG